MTEQARRRTVGVFVHSLANEYNMGVFRALEDAARARDLNVLAFVGGDYHSRVGFERYRNIAYRLASPENIDALVVMQIGAHAKPDDLADLIRGVGSIPVCTIGGRCPGVPCVQVDNDTATRQMLRHLIQRHERKRILFMRGPEEHREVERRFQVYRESLTEFGLQYDPALVVSSEFPIDDARRAMSSYLSEHGANFDALMAASDSFALGALAALQHAGLRVPDDVAVMGFDDVDEARTTVPPLSTARQPWGEQAEIVIEAIRAAWRGEETFDTKTVSAEFIARRSCGCFESSVEQAGRSDRPPTTASWGMAIELAASDMAAVLGPVRAQLPSDVTGRLIRAFEEDLDQRNTEFRTTVEEVAETMSTFGVPVRALQELVTAMRRALLPALGLGDDGTRRTRRAEDLWQQARVICADAAERRQLARVEQAEGVTRVLSDAGRALITTFDTAQLTSALLAELPPLGISACYLLLFEGESPPSEARLLVAHDASRHERMGGEGRILRPRELVPREYLPSRRHSLALIPLCFESDQLGVVLFEVSTKSSLVYEALAEMLSASLKGARLRQELAEEAAQRAKAERERLVQELEIATRIQTSILPRDLEVEGLEIAAAMRPATEVGGDYYEVLPVEGGAWLGIGDVAGHGLRPGVIMVMLQSIVATAVAQSPSIRPRDVVQIANRVLYRNVRERLRQDEHATLSVMRYEKSGRICFAGAHEEIVVFRVAKQRSETFETPGTWVAATLDIEDATVDSELSLSPGDILLLYTDGVIEATNETGKPYGLERLCRMLESHATESVETIRDRLLDDVEAWLNQQLDDIALLVARQKA